jgi:hypothetical protein
MSPLERTIAELIEKHPNPKDTADVIILAAIKSGALDEYRCEALQILKAKMIELKKWVEQSKKPAKDKKYKRTLEVMEMIGACDG